LKSAAGWTLDSTQSDISNTVKQWFLCNRPTCYFIEICYMRYYYGFGQTRVSRSSDVMAYMYVIEK